MVSFLDLVIPVKAGRTVPKEAIILSAVLSSRYAYSRYMLCRSYTYWQVVLDLIVSDSCLSLGSVTVAHGSASLSLLDPARLGFYLARRSSVASIFFSTAAAISLKITLYRSNSSRFRMLLFVSWRAIPLDSLYSLRVLTLLASPCSSSATASTSLMT